MGEVVTYSHSESTCYCQLKLDSGERILISIAGFPKPSIRVIKLKWGGMLPVGTVWESDNPGREILRLYSDKALGLRSDKDILDLFKDDLLQCGSIDEVRERLS